jgi:hypothetical protein
VSSHLYDLIIIGAGPIGLELGIAAADEGIDFLILERGVVAENMRRWGFVQLFTPWEQNTTARGRALCHEDVPGDSLMSGREFRRRYWLPIATSPVLADRVREHCSVVSVGRAGAFKSNMIGDAARAKLPFHVLTADGPRERLFRACHVVDASGVYGNHRWLGAGGIPAPGERAAAEKISYELVDLREESERWAGRTLMIVGSGFSACTAIEQLIQLRADGIDVEAHWAFLSGSATPLPAVENDPLPYRRRLADLGNVIAADSPGWLTVHRGCGVESVRLEGDGLGVALEGLPSPVRCDRLLALVGYRPDRSIAEELQFHECWATSGPMKLAAELLAQSAASGADCLAIGDTGPDALKNPEPGFYVIGAKSYGRNPDFLIQRGHAQVEAVLGFLREDSRPRA